MKVGFIGLGNLGRPMTERLISQGVQLSVFNRTRSKAEAVGVAVAASPAALVTTSDVVFLNLFDSAAVSEVVAGVNGLIEGECEGKIIIDTTTNHFEAVSSFYELIAQVGGSYLEAPVLGSVVPASQGALTIVVSGDSDAYQKVLPLLTLLGSNVFFVEEPGRATRMKLINNLVLGSFMATVAEATVYAEEAGLSREQALNILAVGGGNSGVLNAKKQKLIDTDYSPHFSVAAIHKDLRYLQDLARDIKRPLFMGGMARELFAMAMAKGMDDLDFSAVHRVLREWK